MMQPLFLNPLPTHRIDELSPMRLMERDGFVDEAVVTALLRNNQTGRTTADPDDLALTADDFDFAGWGLVQEVPVRAAEVPPQVIDAIVRRSAPPLTSGPAPPSPSCFLGGWRMPAVALLLRLRSSLKRVFTRSIPPPSPKLTELSR